MVAEGGRFEEIRGVAHDIVTWRELITGSLPPFQRVESPESGEFEGRLWRQVLDRISAHLIEVHSSRHVTRRTAEHIRSHDEPLYVVMFQIEGESVFSQAGQTTTLRPGDYTVSTSTVPYAWEFDGDFTVFMLRFPQTLIDAPPQSLLPLTGQRLTPQNRFGKHLAPFVMSIAQDPDLLRGPVGRRVAQNLVDLFTTSFIAHLDDLAPLGEGQSATSFLRLTEYISRHLHDSDLGPTTIAAANFVSVRTLQALFRDHGTTVSSWIRERRLGNVRRDLALPSQASLTIREIAERWGFEDQSYFSRTFRQEFGETPKQWRQRAFHYPAMGDRRPIVTDDTPAGE